MNSVKQCQQYQQCKQCIGASSISDGIFVPRNSRARLFDVFAKSIVITSEVACGIGVLISSKGVNNSFRSWHLGPRRMELKSNINFLNIAISTWSWKMTKNYSNTISVLCCSSFSKHPKNCGCYFVVLGQYGQYWMVLDGNGSLWGVIGIW